MLSKLTRVENFDSFDPSSANSAKRLPCKGAPFAEVGATGSPKSESCPSPLAGAGDSAGVAFLSFPNTRSMRVRNSISSNIFRRASSSGVSRFSSSMLSSIGTSVLMVAKNLEKAIISLLVSTFVFNAPFNSLEWERRFSMLPNWAISF